MAAIFQCQCGYTKTSDLRDDDIGKQAKCPKCGTIRSIAAETATPQTGAGERIILRDDDILVTTSRIVFGATTYATKTITSVSQGTSSSAKALVLWAVVIGIMAFGVFWAWSLAKEGGPWFIAALLTFGMVVWIGGVAAKSGTRHTIIITTAGGQTTALSDDSRERVRRIVDAINQAIAS